MRPDPVNSEILYQLIGGASPAMAMGVYRDGTFDFHARYDHWDFVLSPFPEVPAGNISHLTWYDLELTQRSDNPFPEDWVRAFRKSFVREGDYGPRGGFEASYMSEDEIGRIVRECIDEYERLVRP